MRMQDPLSGWPRTRPRKKGFRVQAKYLSPERAKFTDSALRLVIIGGFVYIGWLFLQNEFATGEDALTPALVWGGLSALLWGARRSWGRTYFGNMAVIEFQPDAIRIKGGMGFRNYDRSLPHEFDYSLHDKAQQEEEQDIEVQQKAMMEGKKQLPKKGKYYRNAFHIVLRYAGQRVDVAAVFGKKDAEALLVRLQLLDHMMDAAQGDLAAPAWAEPATQYGERPDAG